MIEFVPSWYTDANSWDSKRQSWYREQQIRADDTLSRLRIFRQAGENVGLTNLAFTPGMRRLLLSEGLPETRIWSAFDDMQGISLTECANISFRDLNWPKGIEWVYSPFLLWGYLGEELAVRIEFGQDGEMIETDLYENGQVALHYEWDDRGFVSRVTCHREGKAQYRDYLDPAGIIQFREDLHDGQVGVSSIATHRFHHARYASIGDMVAEVLEKRMSRFGNEDIIIVSSNRRHNELFLKGKRNNKVLLSFTGKELDPDDPQMRRCLQRADGICCDSQWNTERLLRSCPELSKKLLTEPPVDARLELGISSERKEEFLFLPTDGVPDAILARCLDLMETVLEKNENAVVVIAASSYRRSPKQTEAQLRERVSRLSSIRLPAEAEDLGENRVLAENEDEEPPRTVLATFADTAELETLLKDARLLLELAAEPSERLQIMGIGMGIPQILVSASRYVDHLQDGYVVNSLDELPEAIAYYLDDLNHWNEAVLCCAQKVDRYSGENIVRRLKQLAGGMENDQ